MKKYFIYLSITLLMSLIAGNTFARDNITLRFNKNGQFKVAQFTDLHWNPQSPNCEKTVAIIKHVLKTEKPDVAILTGDIVTYLPAKDGWLAVAKIFEDEKTPFSVTLGNHDAEPDITREEIFDLLDGLPYYIGSKGPDLFGCGNYILPVLGSKTENPTAVLYCMDSNDYPDSHKLGHYNWIKFDQIEWYRKASEQFTANNNNIPVPSLMFFHIPILEYNEVIKNETTIGLRRGHVSSPKINSGIFSSMIEKKDVMGVFVGHDHSNNYIGVHYDIALAFGQLTGYDAAGRNERGSRIIQMYEGKQSFDTWIRTQLGTEYLYYYPSGLSSQEEKDADYLPAKNIKVKQQGINYKYFEGRFKSTSDIASAKLLKEGIMNNISIELAPAKDSFAFEYKAYIKILEKGVYRFYTFSDDGSKLLIDGKVVVDNDGGHSNKRADGKIALDAGYHEIQILYFENYMGQYLEVGLSSRNIREDKIPDNMLFIAE